MSEAKMRRALAIGCHPDDFEFMMAGTLLRLKEAGWEIHYLKTLRDMSREVGTQSGSCEYAEGWIRHLHLGLGPRNFDPLAELQGGHE